MKPPVMTVAQRKARMRWEARRPQRLTLKTWNSYVRAEKRLLRGFQLGLDVHELYRRWQDWKTEERLYELATAALDKTANVG